jgi:hypothetical protein
MPDNHLIHLDKDYIEFADQFEKLLWSMEIPFSSQETKDGKIYTVHFPSTFSYEEFKIKVGEKIPKLSSIFN